MSSRECEDEQTGAEHAERTGRAGIALHPPLAGGSLSLQVMRTKPFSSPLRSRKQANCLQQQNESC